MLNEKEAKRYSRQIASIGEEGQERLKSAHVVLAGAGGLGCPAAAYLCAAGVGRLTIIDPDQVELTNLNRQILHWEKDIGRHKVISVREKLEAMNRGVTIEDLCETVTMQNAPELTGQASLIIDALDNFPARYALNQAALQNGIPCVHGAVCGFDGHVTTVIPGRTACLQCIFPDPPGGSDIPVIGTTAGIIGLLQAHEAIKLITGIGTVLENRLLIWDGRDSSVTIMHLDRDPECSVCGNNSYYARRTGETQ
ncbi:MAG TPA: HesA/MoeB/ThiF family protein [Methanoregulaceae archaeon]|nr:MAG: HesA/MoeB/ThiF family protein [Methanolinea sp.]HON82156.1 HesA/MoeB/ThiF family protein [Methanoregulaceae archaeon]HPD10896.1 HesA/MoeB/ThiF family protein [Methanoregulaceae archaeon]HRT16041.1 HesA/MoeB/ThiF family protein [Methanoregulaceae archaeon]HRU31547.1 HesA/MoeB/ThiF family protein [Methanoregulaceae archaeon]